MLAAACGRMLAGRCTAFGSALRLAYAWRLPLHLGSRLPLQRIGALFLGLQDALLLHGLLPLQ